MISEFKKICGLALGESEGVQAQAVQEICCYLNQTGKTTVLSLSPGVVQQSSKRITPALRKHLLTLPRQYTCSDVRR
ncbi:MAG: hypothetical protein GY809_12215 [Planctomycetes bacterium]|nr:hypothetical protein [Planctomycetota bacterium]